MRAEILRSIEKRLRGAQPLEQAELLAITRELQAALGYIISQKTLRDLEFFGTAHRYKPNATASGDFTNAKWESENE